jgi:hypothetical protein
MFILKRKNGLIDRPIDAEIAAMGMASESLRVGAAGPSSPGGALRSLPRVRCSRWSDPAWPVLELSTPMAYP